MDISVNGGRPTPPAAPSPARGTAPKSKKSKLKSLTLLSLALLVSIAILIIAISALAAFGKDGKQSRFVDDTKLQAVFLNGGQVYFGDITHLKDDYLRLTNVYYLRVNQQVQPNNKQQAEQDISLVKLGCELHGPEDEMIINNDQVIFWENLKTDGQVAKAVKQYVEQNPDGQKCETPTTNTNTQNNKNNDSDN